MESLPSLTGSQGSGEVYGYPVRGPYSSERDYFAKNPSVTGMAAEDNQIVLNPFSGLKPEEKQAVARNEAVRLHLREAKYPLDFAVTPEQRQQFQGTPYGENEQALRETLLGRIISGDPSAGKITPEQQQWAERVQAGLKAGRGDLGAAQTYWQEHLLSKPMPARDIRGELERMPPPWIAGQAVEPVEFGALSDPVSQVAFLGAPGLLRGMKGVGEAITTPGPSRGLSGLTGAPYRYGERGNLGPPPMTREGRILPESKVRGESGELLKLYHGTRVPFKDFDTRYYGTGEGSDLYGPGIYMSSHPDIAAGPGYAGKVGEMRSATWEEIQQYYRPGRIVQSGPGRDKVLEFDPGDAQHGWRVKVQAVDKEGKAIYGEHPRWHGSYAPAVPETPNIRPVYADLKKPFDIEAKYTPEQVYDIAQISLREDMSGEDLYQKLTGLFHGKENANNVLRQAGYDGITHIGRGTAQTGPHRVYIAFSPDQVYPAMNVEAITPRGVGK